MGRITEERDREGRWRVAGMSVLLNTLFRVRPTKRFKIILSIKPAGAQKRNFVCFTTCLVPLAGNKKE